MCGGSEGMCGAGGPQPRARGHRRGLAFLGVPDTLLGRGGGLRLAPQGCDSHALGMLRGRARVERGALGKRGELYNKTGEKCAKSVLFIGVGQRPACGP